MLRAAGFPLWSSDQHHIHPLVAAGGTPAVTKQTNKGTAEQEQKGVTIPRRAANTLPANSLFRDRNARVFSGVKKLWIIPTPNTTRKNSIMTLGVS